MSAPTIPNLLSLRGSSRGGARGRGFGRARGTGNPSSAPSPGHDATIQGTDIDAALSRLSAVELGYLEDSFAELFVQQAAPGPSGRRLPIINRGTYTRTTAIDTIVDRFLASTEGQQRQIISLGAGTDTRVLRLFSSSSSSSSSTSSPTRRNITYHEVDFPTICNQKLATVRNSPQLRSILTVTPSDNPLPPPPPLPLSAPFIPTPIPPESSWHARSPAEPTNQLWCHGLDLRTLALRPASSSLPSSSPSSLNAALRSGLPTLLISECCLCYLSPAEAEAVLAHFTSRIPDLGVVLYEPVRPDDAFGRMMVTNLAARRLHMPTLDVYREPRDQDRRLRDAGFDRVEHLTVDAVWDRWVPPEEKERVDALEGLDEVEEWLLLAGHYIVSWAWRGKKFELPVV